jgi:hypothetical protein
MAGTSEERTAIQGRIEGNILGKVKEGVYTTEQGQILIYHLAEQIAIEHVSQVGLESPEKALELLNNKSKGSETYAINPIKRNELIAKFDKTKNNQEVTRLLVDLETRNATTTDPVKNLVGALNEAESTEFLKAHGVEKQTSVITSITNKLRRKQQGIVINDSSIVGKLNKKLVDNTLTDQDIIDSGLSPAAQGNMLRSLRSYTAEQRAEARNVAFENRQKLQDIKIAKQEKSDEISGKLLAQIINGGDVNPLTIIAEQPNGLLPADANKLISNYEKIRNNPDLKAAYKVVDDKFSKVDPVKASQLKNEIYRANLEEGLTGTPLIQRATTMIEGAKSNKVKDMLMNIWTKANEIKTPEEMLRGDKTAPVKTVTIDGKQYKDGDVVEKDGKKFKVRVN